MILYFADRSLSILGRASTSNESNLIIKTDKKSEDVETGLSTYDCTIGYISKERLTVEKWLTPGNYILIGNDKGVEHKLNGVSASVFEIIDAETDPVNSEITIYAEDVGMSLLNTLANGWNNTASLTLQDYLIHFMENTGYGIIFHTNNSKTKILSWDSTSTLIERLQEIVKEFSCEMSFSFTINGLRLTKRYLNVYDKRGVDTKKQLKVGKEIDNVIVKRSISNLATAIDVTGKNADGEEITLYNYQIPVGEDEDGDFIIQEGVLKSNKAYSKWSRTIGSDRHVYKSWTCEDVTPTQHDLYLKAKEDLKKVREPEVNYEVSIVDFPNDIQVGDRTNIIDDKGEIYISGKINYVQ